MNITKPGGRPPEMNPRRRAVRERESNACRQSHDEVNIVAAATSVSSMVLMNSKDAVCVPFRRTAPWAWGDRKAEFVHTPRTLSMMRPCNSFLPTSNNISGRVSSTIMVPGTFPIGASQRIPQ